MKKIFTISVVFVFVVSTCFGQTTDDMKYEQAEKYYKAKEYDKTVPLLKELADKDYAKALDLLGVCYHYGYSVPKNMHKAVDLFLRSANLGWKGSQLNLAYSYINGEGVEKDYALAVYWFQKAAENGSYMAMENLAHMYREGEYFEQDLEKAHEYYIKAAELGYYYAQVNLAWLYQDDEYLGLHDRDDGDVRITEQKFNSITEKWLREAAKQNVEGLYELAYFYEHRVFLYGEKSMYPSPELAYKKAAEAGSGNAISVVGSLMLYEKNYKEAKAMYMQAKSKGVKMTKDHTGEYKTIEMLITLCDFLQKHREYELLLDYDNGYFGSSICLWEDEDIAYVYVRKKGENTGFLKLSKTGKLLGATPFKYDYWLYADYDNEHKAFRIDFDKFIDITGKEVEVEY